MLSLIIYGGFSLQNSGRCSGNSTVNGHSFQSSRDSESWETVRKSPSHLSQTPTIPAHVVRSHWFCGKNNWNEEFRKWQSYIVIEHQTLNDLEKVKWMELVPAFEAGNAGQMEKWDGSSLLVWVDPIPGESRHPSMKSGHKCGALLLGSMEVKELPSHHLQEECPLRSQLQSRQQEKAWVGERLLLSYGTSSLFYKPGIFRPRHS